MKTSPAQGRGGPEIAEHPAPRISLVSVTFNATGFVAPFCSAVAHLTYPDLEIIVVDNASRDGTAAEVRRLLPQAMVIESDRNLGFAGGSNLGATRASGDVLFFLNPDTLPPPDAVAQLCGPVARRPEIGAAGCKLVFPDGRLQSAGGVLGPNAHCVHRGHGEADRGQFDEEAIVDYVPGAALAIRRTLFAEVGGFYVGYFPGFYEDAELCVRLRERGYEVHYFPTPRIVHLESASMSAASTYWMQRNRLLFLARLGPPRRLGALVREARWLYSTYLGPLGRALFGGHPWRLHAEWRRLRPVLAGTVAAVLRAPGAVREARRAPSAAADRCARACRSARTIMAQSTSVMLSAVSPMQDVSGAFQGFVDYYDTERVAGWVFDGADPEQQLEVEIRVPDGVLGVALADRFRADLHAAGVSSGRHGFEFRFPVPISDGDVRELQVVVRGRSGALPFSRRRDFLDGATPPATWDQLQRPLCESPFMEAIILRDRIHAEQADLIRNFSTRGLLRIKLTDPAVGHLLVEVVRTLRDRYQGARRIQDAWSDNPAVRHLACLPEILDLLRLLYGRPAIPMQTLNFPVGTEQSAHTDTIHFDSMPPRFMCGVWVALEPITERNGPLYYYPGSHRLPVVTLDDLGLVADEARWSDHYEKHQEVLRALIKVSGIKKQVVLAERGEAIVWAANLCHGGEPIADPASTRHSQVTHYYFEGCAYYTPMVSNVYLGRVRRPDRRDIRTGEPLVPRFGLIPVDIPKEPRPLAPGPHGPRDRLRRWITSTFRGGR